MLQLQNKEDLEYVREHMGFSDSYRAFEDHNIERYEAEKLAGGGTAKRFPCTRETVDIFADVYREDLATLGYDDGLYVLLFSF
jgi:hypothetical protein